MKIFGHYVSVHELRRTGLTVVYSGRDDISPDDKFAIKVLESSALFADKTHEKVEADQFLNSARLQQKMAGGGSQHWAPIHEYGSSPGGTFYVTDKYERSLQELIDGQVELGAKGLHAIIKPIVEGLKELKKAYKRPHGNLKATNVLITGASSEMKVALSDPLPDESIDAKAHWHDDLRAIGELIYQLVVHRPAPSLVGARISGSKDWAGLKRQAGDWRDICARLLAVRISPEAITLESLVEELTELGKSKPVLSRRRLAMLSIILLVIGIAVVKYGIPRSPLTPEKWELLCDDYLKWVEPLYNNLKITSIKDSYDKSFKNGPAKAWLDGDPNFAKILPKEHKDSMIWKAGFPSRLRLVRTKEKTVEEIKYSYDLVRETYGSNNFSKEADKAINAVNSIKNFFDPNTTETSESWPVLVTILEAATKFNQEYWLKPAALYLNYLVAKVRPPNKEIFQGVNEILDLKEKNFRDILEEIDSVRKDVGQYTNGKRVKVAGELSGVAQDYSTIKTSKDFDGYINKLRGFRNIENIHQEYKEKWDPKYTDTNLLVGNLRSIPENKKNAVKYRSSLKDLKTNFEQLKQNLEKERVYYIAKNEEDIKNRYEELTDNLQNLWNRIVEDLNDPSDWLRDLEGRRITNFEALQKKWEKRQKELLDDVKVSKLKSDDYITYTAVEPNVEASWDRLNRLQKLGTDLFQEFEEQLRPFDEKKMQIDELTGGYRNALEEAFREIEDNELFDDSFAYAIPETNEPGSFKHQLWRKLAQLNPVNGSVSGTSATNLIDLVDAYSDIRKQFRFFYLPEDKKTESFAEVFEDRFNKLKNDKVFSRIFDPDSKTGEAFSILENKIDKIRNIKNMQLSGLRSQVDKVLKDTDDQVLYAVYVGLEKASEDPKWPKDSNEWDKDQRIKKLLQERIRAIQDGSNRAEELEKELDGIFAKRKEHFEKLKPPYCKHLDRYRQNGQNILVFAEGIALRENFLPVIDSSGDLAEVSAWDVIRQAVDNKQEKWTGFFHTTSDNNAGWPKYIKSTKDPSVILRFIPADNGNPEPFYMAVREITNAQYATFLTNINAKKKGEAYHDPNGNILLEWDRLLPYPLFWENHNEKLIEYPVTYVTQQGAFSYANWLAPGKAQLPTGRQHEYALRATSYTLPWSSDPSKILSFAHVRAKPWQAAAKKWNNRGTWDITTPEPFGAKLNIDKDYVGEKKLRVVNIDRIVVSTYYPRDRAYSAWPIASATEPNEWGLFDMIGNVWEWCRNSEFICGGSCLAPSEYIPDCKGFAPGNYSTKFSDLPSSSDIGLRVIVSIQ